MGSFWGIFGVVVRLLVSGARSPEFEFGSKHDWYSDQTHVFISGYPANRPVIDIVRMLMIERLTGSRIVVIPRKLRKLRNAYWCARVIMM